MSDELYAMSLAKILTFFRPGSHDWNWASEYADLINHERTKAIEERCLNEGWDFIDDVSPVMLGNDGRVWDGHHRIVLAILHEVSHLNVEFVR